MNLDELKGVLRALPDPTLVLSSDATVLASNRAAQQALGLAPSVLHGSHLGLRLQQPGSFEGYLKLCARSPEPLPGAFTLQREGADGQRFRCDGARLSTPLEGVHEPVLLRFRPKEEFDQFVLLTERLHQLTAEVKRRQEVEAALRDSEQRFRLLAEVVPQLVWMARPDGAYDYVNQRLCDYSGISLEQVRCEGWSCLLHPEDLPRTAEAWQRSITTGEPFQMEFRLRQGLDDTARWFLGRALPACDDSGRILMWFGTCTDIHEQKRAEQEAIAAVGVRDEFLSMAAHELKTPLTSLKLQLALLARALAGPEGRLPQQADARLQAAHRQISRLNALNDSLLDVSRLSSGRLSLELQQVDLTLLVRESVERLEPELLRVGCEVSLDLEPEVMGLWDPLRLDQVVVNLLTNAIKYAAGKPVEICLRERSGSVLLSVKDFGIGMTPEAASRIFRKFERAVPTEHYSGLGLGLYISKQIIGMMGGYIGVESTLGVGTTFTILLPQAPAVEADHAARQPSSRCWS